jgi:hypothetical protein
VDTKAGAKTAEERHRESLETQQQLIEAMAKRRHEAVALVKKRNARVTTPRTALTTSRSMPTLLTDLTEVRRFALTFSLARLRMRSCVRHCGSEKLIFVLCACPRTLFLSTDLTSYAESCRKTGNLQSCCILSACSLRISPVLERHPDMYNTFRNNSSPSSTIWMR